MTPRRFLPRLTLTAALTFGAAPAIDAHAFLDHASPAVGSTVHASPKAVRLWFSDSIEVAFSTISVTDDSGRRVDDGKAEVDGKDAAVLQTALRALPPGPYTVTWRVISVDSHVTQGKFTFKVAP
jgi:methionine-rich copper-binding protein CopC